MTTVTVKINKDGSKVTTEVEGAAGSSCRSLTAALEAALGQQVGQELKSEFYMENTLTQELSNGQ